MLKSASSGDVPLSAALATARAREQDSRGAFAEARNGLRQWLAESPTVANTAAAARQWENWEANPLPGETELRLSVLGTGTLGPLGRYLRVAVAGMGLHPRLHVGEFNQWAQELLDGHSAVYAFAPEVIALCIDVHTLFPRTCDDPFLTETEQEAERVSGVQTLLRGLQAASRHAGQAFVILHTFAVPDEAPLGILDARTIDNQRERIARINRDIADAVRMDYPRVFLLDQERMEARFGKSRVRAPRHWYMASVPFSDEFMQAIASDYVRVLKPLKGLTRKAIVLDLDNTLWGGVVGEDGMASLKLGGTAAPGNAFRDFQAALNNLRQRGILLALCTKNNENDVLPVLRDHPEMLLRLDAFAAVRINWDDKATNIASIARELNIGLDSLVFLDDNPAERGLVRERLPAVLTPDLPRDPALYVSALQALDVFETIALTDEDRRRGEMYLEQRERREAEQKITGAETEGGETGGVADYLADLQIVVELSPSTPFILPRIAQLINKTNQFNLTTRRTTEAEIQAKVDDPASWAVYSATVRDRFGDSGLTGVAVVHKTGNMWEIDSFLLSCRVMSRGIEQALVNYIAKRARQAGADTLRGLFIPTAKNTPAADFYARMGFSRDEPTMKSDGEYWIADLADSALLADNPAWLTIVEKNEENNAINYGK